VPVGGLDLAGHPHGDALDRPVGREHVDDVAEGVLAGFQPAVGARLDAPAQDVLPVVVAGGEAQGLHEGLHGPLVAVDGVVDDSDAHRSSRLQANARSRAHGPDFTQDIARR
jgi:hypothetical protein